MEWIDGNRILIDPPKKPRKITGTRLASILGLNPWSTPFEAWCDITRLYKEPFEDNKYTLAGKAIEPKQLDYLKKAYYMPEIVTAEDMYGPNPYKTTRGDFFPEVDIFGGMWDALALKESRDTEKVIECKTTKRSEDWEFDTPEYYAIQAALYAILHDVDEVIMMVSFLEDMDYISPELFEPNAENTLVRPFRLSERYGNFELVLDEARDWWNNHIVTGVSPPYDEKADADILAELRKTSYHPDTDVEKLVEEAEMLRQILEGIAVETKPVEKRLKEINDILKKDALTKFRPGDTKVTWKGPKYEWSLTKVESTALDTDRLKEDGLLEKYQIKKLSYRLLATEIKEVEV